jgi:hypothetical protein
MQGCAWTTIAFVATGSTARDRNGDVALLGAIGLARSPEQSRLGHAV